MTEDEARDWIIRTARFSVWYWATQVSEDTPCAKRLEGVMHTFFAEIDGCGDGPLCDVVVLQTDAETGNAIGETRVSTMLHEYLYADGWKADRCPL